MQLVEWLYEGSTTGKRVFLDGDHRIVFSVAANYPLENMSSATMLLKDCGNRMRKVAEDYRDHLQELPLRLLTSYQLAATQSDLASGMKGARVPISQGECMVCQKDCQLHPENVEQCALCLMSFHGRCAHSSLGSCVTPLAPIGSLFLSCVYIVSCKAVAC